MLKLHSASDNPARGFYYAVNLSLILDKPKCESRKSAQFTCINLTTCDILNAMEYVTPQLACKILGIDASTLRRWARGGKIGYIQMPSRHHRYAVGHFISEQLLKKPEKAKKESDA
jgi:hypothetical protein